MTDKKLIKALSRLAISTGSLACLGCGHEHSCGIRGCAIVRAAADRIEELSALPWIDAHDRLPETDDYVLAIVNGKPKRNITLIDAVKLASYLESDGWLIEAYPGWENPNITYWMPMPETPEEA